MKMSPTFQNLPLTVINLAGYKYIKNDFILQIRSKVRTIKAYSKSQ